MSESDIPKTLLQKLVSLWSSVIDKTGGSTGNKWAIRTTSVLAGKDPSAPSGDTQATITSADATKDANTTILAVQHIDATGKIAPSPNVSATGELKIVPGTSVTDTPAMAVYTTSITVTAGKKSITIVTNSTFTGTILGAVAEADTVYTFTASVGALLGAIAIVVTTGSCTVLTTV